MAKGQDKDRGKEPLTMLTVRLPAGLVKRLKLLAAANDVSIQDIVQDALEKHVTLDDQTRGMLKALLLSQKPLHIPGAKRRKGAK